MPLIAVHITQAEWDHVGKVAFSKFTPKQRFTAMGEMLAAASPTEAARMLAGLPAPVKLIWRLFGRRRYERLIPRSAARRARAQPNEPLTCTLSSEISLPRSPSTSSSSTGTGSQLARVTTTDPAAPSSALETSLPVLRTR